MSPLPQPSKASCALERPLAVAPMMNWTTRHCRRFHRLLSRHVLLYTEMVVAQSLLYAGGARYFAHSPQEDPVVLQLGGNCPQTLAQAAKIAAPYGFAGINLNAGCPSPKVMRGCFGARLMQEPERTADCLNAMAESGLPVSIKTRLGIDKKTHPSFLWRFIETILRRSRCRHVIIHARAAWLEGLSPKDNRTLPPLCIPQVYDLKKRYPELHVVLNGGTTTLAQAREHLRFVDGVMIGRAAYRQPYILAEADSLILGQEQAPVSRTEVVTGLKELGTELTKQGIPASALLRHALGLYHGQPQARAWRRALSSASSKISAQDAHGQRQEPTPWSAS